MLLPNCAFAGDHFFGPVLILASIPAETENYVDNPSGVREFYAEEAAVIENFRASCSLPAEIFNSSTTIGSPQEEGSTEFRDNYWVIIAEVSPEIENDSEALQNFLETTRIQHPECPQDMYIREVHIGAPTLPPYCEWARENDASIFEEYCEEIYNQILNGE